VTRLPAHRRARLGLSRTFQVSNLFAGLSVLDNVRLAAQAGQPSRWRLPGLVRPGDRVGLAAMEALERAGIAARAGDRVSELSHGEQRQLEVALALATSPRLLLLDEPAAGLSAGERSRLRELLGSLPDSLPLLLIEHDMTLALSLTDEVLCLHNGRPIALGPPDRVRGDPTVQAVYLGRTVDA
jgi:branched-chain amino acid transport system ATP-binding protein